MPTQQVRVTPAGIIHLMQEIMKPHNADKYFKADPESLVLTVEVEENRPQGTRMLTLEESNRQRRKQHQEYTAEPQRNGIACNKCGAELYDSYPGSLLLSNPPQRQVHCENCEFVGYRVV